MTMTPEEVIAEAERLVSEMDAAADSLEESVAVAKDLAPIFIRYRNQGLAPTVVARGVFIALCALATPSWMVPFEPECIECQKPLVNNRCPECGRVERK